MDILVQPALLESLFFLTPLGFWLKDQSLSIGCQEGFKLVKNYIQKKKAEYSLQKEFSKVITSALQENKIDLDGVTRNDLEFSIYNFRNFSLLIDKYNQNNNLSFEEREKVVTECLRDYVKRYNPSLPEQHLDDITKIFSQSAFKVIQDFLQKNHEEFSKEVISSFKRVELELTKISDKQSKEFSEKQQSMQDTITFFHELVPQIIEIKTHLQDINNSVEKIAQNQEKSRLENKEGFELIQNKIDKEFQEIKRGILLKKHIENNQEKIKSEVHSFLEKMLKEKPFESISELYTPIRAYKDPTLSRIYREKKESYQNNKQTMKPSSPKMIERKIEAVWGEGTGETTIKTLWQPHDSIGQKESQEKREDLFNDYDIENLVENEKRLFLIGESGSGKTTTLRWLTAKYAQKYLNESGEEIPFYIELNTYSKGDIFNFVRIKMREYGLTDIETIRYLLENEKLIFFIDGLDLLQLKENSRELLEELINFFTEYPHHYVISSQPGIFEPFASFMYVKLGDLSSPNQMNSFLKNTVNDYTKKFLDEYPYPDEKFFNSLKDEIENIPELQALCRNPLMYYLVIGVALDHFFSGGNELIPTNRSILYEKFIKGGIFRHYKSKFGIFSIDDEINVTEILVDFYFVLLCKNKTSEKIKETWNIIDKKINTIMAGYHSKRKSNGEFLADICEMGLLKKEDDLITFGIHQSFQYYFASIRLVEMYNNGISISQVFCHPLWEKTIVFSAGMVDSPNQFVSSILDSGNTHLAAKCSEFVDNSIKERIKEKLTLDLQSRQISNHQRALDSLARLGTIGICPIFEYIRRSNNEDNKILAISSMSNSNSKQMIEILIRLIEYNPDQKGTKLDVLIESQIQLLKQDRNYDASIRPAAIQALARIKTKQSVDPLISALRSNNYDVRIAAAQALGEMKSEKAIDPLISLLTNGNFEVRAAAAQALGKIKSEKAVDPLISVLKTDCSKISFLLSPSECAAQALGNIQSKKSLEPLIAILSDKKSNGRRYAAQVIGMIKSLHESDLNRSIDALIFLLSDNDYQIREAGAYSLGEIRSEKAVPFLISLLKDKKSTVRSAAVQALRKIQSESAIQPLITLIVDKDFKTRWSAANALGGMNSDKAIDSLAELISNNDPDIRKAAIYAIGLIFSERSGKLLIPLMNDEDPVIRKMAAKSLGNMTSNFSKIRKEEWLNGLDNLHDEKSINNCLVTLRTDNTVDSLIILLKDENPDIRKVACYALGGMNSERSIGYLQQLLKENNPIIRIAVTNALREIKSDQTISPLISLLYDKDPEVCYIAVQALMEKKTDRAFEPLITLLNSKNSSIQSVTIQALWIISSSNQYKRMKELSKSDNLIVANVAYEISNHIELEESAKQVVVF